MKRRAIEEERRQDFLRKKETADRAKIELANAYAHERRGRSDSPIMDLLFSRR